MRSKNNKTGWSPRFRLMPLTLLCLGLMLGIKLSDASRSGQELFEALLVGNVVAEQTQEPGKLPAEETGKAEDAPSEEAPKEEAEKSEQSENKEKGEIKEETSSDHADTPKKEESAEAGKEPAKPVDLSKPEFTQIELDLLQSLSKRREHLDNLGKELEMKETLLNATEMRIDAKIEQIKKLKKEAEVLLAQYNEKEDAKIRSLVKIYENMKPKDAAAIFEELDMPVLLLVADRMSERKVAPILAGMTPKKAMELTTELAEQRELQQYTQQSVEELNDPSAGATPESASPPPEQPAAAPTPPITPPAAATPPASAAPPASE